MSPVAPLPDPSYQGHQSNQTSKDIEQLNLLSIFFYVLAGLMALAGLVFLFQIIMGAIIAASSIAPSTTVTVSPSTFPGAPTSPPTTTTVPSLGQPVSFGWIFVGIGALGLLVIETLAAFTFMAGRSLAKRERKTLVQIVAGILCLNVPLGTALGVFTFVVLSRASVAALFDAPRSS
jgi:hypothetical protein